MRAFLHIRSIIHENFDNTFQPSHKDTKKETIKKTLRKSLLFFESGYFRCVVKTAERGKPFHVIPTNSTPHVVKANPIHDRSGTNVKCVSNNCFQTDDREHLKLD